MSIFINDNALQYLSKSNPLFEKIKNAPIFNGSETNVFPNLAFSNLAGDVSFVANIPNSYAGKQLLALPDVINVSNIAIRDETIISRIYIMGYYKIIDDGEIIIDEGFELITEGSRESDELINGIFSDSALCKVMIPNIPQDEVIFPSRIKHFESLLVVVEGHDAGFSYLYDSPTNGRFLLAVGPDDGQRNAAWGDWINLVGQTIPTKGFFTDEPESVNFTALTSENIARIQKFGAKGLYDALSGNDTVTLPNLAGYQLTADIKWDSSQTFHGGQGEDKIVGGDGADKIDGGGDADIINGGPGSDMLFGGAGNDQFIGSSGSDELQGGDGADTFDFLSADLSSMDSGTLQKVNGGSNPDASQPGPASQPDVLKLPGSPSDYNVFQSFVGYSGGSPLHTTIRLSDPAKASLVKFDVTNVELITFSGPMTNKIVANSLVLEALRLAKESYGPQPTLEHSAEELASQFGPTNQTDGITLAAQGRGWHPLSALELGIAAAYKDPANGLDYSFSGGHYQAVTSKVVLGDRAEANAIILIGVLNGKKTLAIAFRGTDQWADFGDYGDFTTQHYAKFAPLIAGLDAYIQRNSDVIDKVLVVGHSLGAGMVQEFMAHHADDKRFEAVTIGSPGGDEIGGNAKDPRIVNFAHTDDPVAGLAITASSLATNGFARAALALFFKVAGRSDLVETIHEAQPKHRDGSLVAINSGVSVTSLTGIAEHSYALYLSDVGKLVGLAKEKSHPFYKTDFALSLRDNTIYHGNAIQIAVTNSAGGSISTITGDNYILGSESADCIFWNGRYDPDHIRVIDGYSSPKGTQDTLIFNENSNNFKIQLINGNHYDLTLFDRKFAETWGIEKLVFLGAPFDTVLPFRTERAALALASTLPSSPVVYLDGTAPKVLRPTVGAKTFKITSGTDYVETGTANLSVSGSAGNDVIMLGGGIQQIAANAGNDIVNAIQGKAGSVFTITGGVGDDVLIGRSDITVVAVFSGNFADYSFEIDGNGATIISDNRGRGFDGRDSLSNVTTVRFADGDYSVAALLAPNVPIALEGTDGSDTLAPIRDGVVVASGLDGLDDVKGGAQADVLDGGAGDDVIAGLGGDDTIFGSDGNDTLIGGFSAQFGPHPGDGADTGADALRGGLGNDFLIGGDGNDQLYGGAGDDDLKGDAGSDLLDGGAGDDSVVYYLGAAETGVILDFRSFKPGEDFTFVDPLGGTDTLRKIEKLGIGGSNFDDVLTGSQYAVGTVSNRYGNRIFGLAGNDTMTGGDDTDLFNGGTGNDTINGSIGIDVRVDDAVYDFSGQNETTGKDLVSAGVTFSAAALVRRDTTTQLDAGVLGVDSLTGIDHLLVVGSRFSDTLTGSGLGDFLNGGAGDDILSGGDGNDQLDGGTGDDKMIGGAGVDFLNGGTGDDKMIGGAGVDFYWVDAAGDTIDELAAGGDDSVFASISCTLANYVEVLGLIGTDNLDGTGNTLDNSISGNTGNNKLSGSAGNDVLFGNEGNDELDGGKGSDELLGGKGNDAYYVESAGDLVYETATPSETIDLGGTDTVFSSINFTLGQFVENLTLRGKANLAGTGNDLANTVSGNKGANTLEGLAGNDILKGGAGKDTLKGGAGNDKLYGGDGKDTLTGGGGNDTFFFNTAPTSRDTITDFSAAEGDKIQLSKAVFKSLAYTGSLHAEDFYAAAGATKAHDATDRVIYNTTTGVLYYDPDGRGGAAAVQVALLGASTHPALVFSDLQIIA